MVIFLLTLGVEITPGSTKGRKMNVVIINERGVAKKISSIKT